MYLRDGPERLQADIAAAKKGGYFLGVKIVRGAYLASLAFSYLYVWPS